MDDWKKFLKLFLAVFVSLIVAVVALILWTNPDRNIPYITTDRPLMNGNQRFMYPSIARDMLFDSGVFGNSSVRFLKPERLDRELGGRFAVLGMDAATPWEQYRLARLFHEERAKNGVPVRTVIHGVARDWCQLGEDYPKVTKRLFPEWMYDDDPWNDLPYLLNSTTIEVAVRVAAEMLGLRDRPHFERNGYGEELPPIEQYDVVTVRRRIYGSKEPQPVIPVEPPVALSVGERQSQVFGPLELMPDLLALSPAETEVILVFVPYHEYIQPRPGSLDAALLAECKARVVALAAERPNTMVLDFNRPSEINSRDENFWDPVHYGHATAALIVDIIARAVRGEGGDADNMTVLHDGLRR